MEREHSFHQSVLDRLQVSTFSTIFTGTKSISMISCILNEHYKHEKYQPSRCCNQSCSFFDALHIPVFGFDGETLLSGSQIKGTCTIRLRSIDRMSSSSLCNLTASQMCQSNEDDRPSISRPPRHNHHGCPI